VRGKKAKEKAEIFAAVLLLYMFLLALLKQMTIICTQVPAED
jgi:hypothetical protein